MIFEMYARRTLFGRRWSWRLRAANNEIIAQGESYTTGGTVSTPSTS